MVHRVLLQIKVLTNSYFGYVLYISKNWDFEAIFMTQITINNYTVYVSFEFFCVWAMEIVTV